MSARQNIGSLIKAKLLNDQHRMIPTFDKWTYLAEPTIIEALRGVCEDVDDLTPRLYAMYLKSYFEKEIVYN